MGSPLMTPIIPISLRVILCLFELLTSQSLKMMSNATAPFTSYAQRHLA